MLKSKKLILIIISILLCNSCNINFNLFSDYSNDHINSIDKPVSDITKNIYYKYDADKYEISISLFKRDDYYDRTSFSELPSVYNRLGYIRTITFVSDGEIFYPDTITDVFNCFDLRRINGFDYVDTSYVKDFSYSFYACECINDEILKNIKTNSGEDFNHMFYENDALVSFDFSNYDFSNAVNLESMFESCTFLENVNFEKSNLINVKNINSLFSNCTHLKKVDFSNCNIGSIDRFGYVFYLCEDLNYIDISNLNLTSYFIESSYSDTSKDKIVFCDDCRRLETLVLPLSFQYFTLDNNFFLNCPNLSNIY